MIHDTDFLAAVVDPLGNRAMNKDALDFVTSMEYDTIECLTTVQNAEGTSHRAEGTVKFYASARIYDTCFAYACVRSDGWRQGPNLGLSLCVRLASLGLKEVG